MNERLLNIISKIDLPTLHKLVGIVILKAIRAVNKGEDERAIAEILLLKYDILILNNKEIRMGIINSLSITDAIILCKKSGLDTEENFKAYQILINFYSLSYNSVKSKYFIDFFELDEKFLFKQIVELREPKEIITASFGEEVKILSYLHDYQKRVKDETMIRLNQKTEKSFFVQMPTGAGKTYTALECVVALTGLSSKNLEDDLIPLFTY